jgi:hypothetical protein
MFRRRNSTQTRWNQTSHRFVADTQQHSHDETHAQRFVPGTRHNRAIPLVNALHYRCDQRWQLSGYSLQRDLFSREKVTTEALYTHFSTLDARKTDTRHLIYSCRPKVRGLSAFGTSWPTTTVLQEHSSSSRTLRWKCELFRTVNSTMVYLYTRKTAQLWPQRTTRMTEHRTTAPVDRPRKRDTNFLKNSNMHLYDWLSQLFKDLATIHTYFITFQLAKYDS